MLCGARQGGLAYGRLAQPVIVASRGEHRMERMRPRPRLSCSRLGPGPARPTQELLGQLPTHSQQASAMFLR